MREVAANMADRQRWWQRVEELVSVAAAVRAWRSCSGRDGGEARPHVIRHGAITAVLDLSGGDVRAAQRFSRHQDVRTLLRYDDNRQDLGGKMARMVAFAD